MSDARWVARVAEETGRGGCELTEVCARVEYGPPGRGRELLDGDGVSEGPGIGGVGAVRAAPCGGLGGVGGMTGADTMAKILSWGHPRGGERH